jgi:TrmH family RNA methyltransferase
MLKNIRIVMIATSHPGNIGAAARAMKNMSLDQLYLVSPKRYPSEEAAARASGAGDLLARSKVVETLDEALVGCRYVVGASARLRKIEWPLLEPRACAEKMVGEAEAGDVALLFGREKSGLTNEELNRCHHLVHIPTNPEYSSLNIAAAIQVLVYELFLASRQEKKVDEVLNAVAPAEQIAGFHRHLEQAMLDLGFSDLRKSDKLLRRLHLLFNRARPNEDELNILRGILSAAQGRKSMRR